MRSGDTIAAISTPRGEGGIAIIRMSGPRAREILRKMFVPAGRNAKFESMRMYFGRVTDADGREIDQGMAVYMAAPRTYTREDVVEIHCHGGRVVTGEVLSRVISLGARPAEPGEFTRLAFVNGRIDLSQAEAVMDVISASGRAAARAAVRQLSGGASAFVVSSRAELAELLALIEASNDFPEEIDESDVTDRVHERAEEIIRKINLRINEGAARAVREGVSIVIAGRPNVGKSSLLNALIGSDRAIVADLPGTTRDVITERMTIAGVQVELSDTAGQREVLDEIEASGVNRARVAQREADIVIIVLDASSNNFEDDPLIEGGEGRYIFALNKCDLMRGDFRPAGLPGPEIYVSALTGEGVPELMAEIERRVNTGDDAGDILINVRHIDLAKRAVLAISSSLEAIESGAPLDVAAIGLWDAIRALGEITGEDVGEKVVDEIFKNFCVGK